MSRHVYEVLAQVIAREGVTDGFALLGDANMHVATVLEQSGCRMIHVRHEHNAAAAATAYARMKGGDAVGFATVTCGPGLTQLATALPAAARARVPLVVLAGEAPLSKRWYNQQIDQAPIVTACGARYVPVHHAPTLPERVRDAFLTARRERVPVVIGVPFDLQEEAWAGSPDLPPPSLELLPRPAPQLPHGNDVSDAAAMIGEAERIVVLGGLGAKAAGAGPALARLAERLGALLATTLPARGLFGADPFDLGVAGGFSSVEARRCFGEADLVIAVGASLSSHNADAGKLWPKARVLHVDEDPVAVNQGRTAAHAHLRGDARLAVEALFDALPDRGAGWRTEERARAIAEGPMDDAVFAPVPGTHDPRDVVAALDDAIPKDAVCVNSSGHCSFYAAHMRGRAAHDFLTIREFGAIGNGIAYAMGAAVARPQARIYCFDGDGSLMMHVQELDTVRRHGLDVTMVVFNDGAFGSEIHKLRADGLPDDGAVHGRADFAAIAAGFGVAGHRLADLDDAAMLAARNGAAVWDVPVNDRVASPVIQRAHPSILDWRP